MSENQVKDRIVEKIKRAKETGVITAQKIHDIVRKAVADAVSETKGGAEAIRPIVKDAISAAVERLRAPEADAAENIKAVLEGAVAGARAHKDQAVAVVRKELREVEEKLAAEKTELTQYVRDALQGAKEAGALWPEEIGTRIKSLSADIKLQSTELFGLTKQTVKDAVKQALKSGEDIKKTVAQIARDTTERALKEKRFTADRMKRIAEKVMSGAIEAAEEADKEVKDVARGAFEGAQKGIASAVEAIGVKTKEFVHDDLARTKEDLETIQALFLETAGRVAKRSGETAKAVLVDLVEQTEKTTSALREKTGHATEKVAERLKKAGKEAVKTSVTTADKLARAMADETMALGKRSVDVARGALSGMWKGAKDALKKDKNK
jgi:hypothetical protein